MTLDHEDRATITSLIRALEAGRCTMPEFVHEAGEIVQRFHPSLSDAEARDRVGVLLLRMPA